MRTCLCILLTAWLAPAATCPVDKDFTTRKTIGQQPQDKGEWTQDGWKVNSEQTQLEDDLGKH